MQEDAVAFDDRQNELIIAVTAGDLRQVKQCFDYKGFNENGPMCTLVISKIFNLQYEQIVENHFLILQMMLSLHPQLDKHLITNVCHWLIILKDKSKNLALYFGPRIFTLLRQCGHIDDCDFNNLRSVNDIRVSVKILAHAKSLSTEILTAILTDNVEAFERLFTNMPMNYETYKEILQKCLEIENKSYGIVSWLLEQQPLSIESPQNVNACIALLQNYLFVNNQDAVASPQLNAAKVSMLQYISLCYSLAKNRGPLRADLTNTVRQLLQRAGIADDKTTNVEELICKLICNINPDFQHQMEASYPPKQKHSIIDLGIFVFTLAFNVVRVRTDSRINRRNDIDDDIMVGMIPGCKCGLSIIDSNKKKGKPLALVVTCLKSHEVHYNSVLYTPANPAFWLNRKIEQIFVALKDFGFDADPSEVFTAVDKIHEVIKHKKGGVYIHCKAGKGRSVMILALYYVLFRADFWQGSLMDTIKFVYNYIQARRPQINNEEKSWNAVQNYVTLYLQRQNQHPDVVPEVKESVDDFILLGDVEDGFSLNSKKL